MTLAPVSDLAKPPRVASFPPCAVCEKPAVALHDSKVRLCLSCLAWRLGSVAGKLGRHGDARAYLNFADGNAPQIDQVP